MGRLSDTEISLRLGRTLYAVRSKRAKRGVKDPSTRHPWTRAEERFLGRFHDADIAVPSELFCRILEGPIVEGDSSILPGQITCELGA